jgi:hypothetical protein
MTTTTLTKTQGGTLLAHTQQATAVVTVGSAVDVSTKMAAQCFVKLGRTVATALTNEVNFRIEASAKSSGNDEWFPVYQWTSTYGKTTANSSTVNDATFNAADTSFTITSATGIAAGDQLYFRETGTPANSEWSRVSAVSGTTITLEEAVTRGHTNGIAVTDYAESWSIYIDCAAIGRLRLVVDTASAASGQTVDVIGWVVTLDSASNV